MDAAARGAIEVTVPCPNCGEEVAIYWPPLDDLVIGPPPARMEAMCSFCRSRACTLARGSDGIYRVEDRRRPRLAPHPASPARTAARAQPGAAPSRPAASSRPANVGRAAPAPSQRAAGRGRASGGARRSSSAPTGAAWAPAWAAADWEESPMLAPPLDPGAELVPQRAAEGPSWASGAPAPTAHGGAGAGAGRIVYGAPAPTAHGGADSGRIVYGAPAAAVDGGHFLASSQDAHGVAAERHRRQESWLEHGFLDSSALDPAGGRDRAAGDAPADSARGDEEELDRPGAAADAEVHDGASGTITKGDLSVDFDGPRPASPAESPSERAEASEGSQRPGNSFNLRSSTATRTKMRTPQKLAQALATILLVPSGRTTRLRLYSCRCCGGR
ncbi:unnamed protein product [Prorocentrum cordatum]|uniref:Uncharacterized protein n=1 Tax=Prorocentrum cordatum TaxID=2364126 RepID=A0ABN9SZP4_9DINO|nr:unnamed protein product [Polarella glacialis]